MRCIICDSPCEYFMTINYYSTPFCKLAMDFGLYEAHLFKCTSCGSVISQNHMEMSTHNFFSLMREGHDLWEQIKDNIFQNSITNFPCGTAPHLQIATLVKLIMKNSILQGNKILDYAAGYGHLSHILEKYFDIRIINYEPFSVAKNMNYQKEIQRGLYNLVINSAMFQCLINLEPIKEMCSFLKKNGILLLQTVVAENISYELARHCFFTPMVTNLPSNKGMQIVMDKFGFVSSCYSPRAKSWLLFRESCDIKLIGDINKELLANELICQNGFIGYWK